MCKDVIKVMHKLSSDTMKTNKAKLLAGLLTVLAGCLPSRESSSQQRPVPGGNERTIEERVDEPVAKSLGVLGKIKNTGCYHGFCFEIVYPASPNGDLLSLEYKGRCRGEEYPKEARIIYSICGAYLNAEQRWVSSCAAGGSRIITGPFKEGQTLGGVIKVDSKKVLSIYSQFAYQIGHLEFHLDDDLEPEINLGDFVVRPENLPKK